MYYLAQIKKQTNRKSIRVVRFLTCPKLIMMSHSNRQNIFLYTENCSNFLTLLLDNLKIFYFFILVTTLTDVDFPVVTVCPQGRQVRKLMLSLALMFQDYVTTNCQTSEVKHKNWQTNLN